MYLTKIFSKSLRVKQASLSTFFGLSCTFEPVYPGNSHKTLLFKVLKKRSTIPPSEGRLLKKQLNPKETATCSVT